MSSRIRDKSLYIVFVGAMVLTILGLCYFYFFKVLEVDLSKNMEIEYSGESGYATISIKNNSTTYDQRHLSFLESISYESFPSEGLSNGDEVSIKVKYNKDLASLYNYYVVGDELSIQVEGLPTRIDSVDLLDEKMIEELTKVANTHIKENEKEITTSQVELDKLKKVEIVSSELTFQSFMKSNAKIRGDSIFQLYKITVEGQDIENKKELHTFYYGIEFEDINSLSSKENTRLIVEKLDQEQLKDLTNDEEFMRYIESKFSLEFKEFYIIPKETVNP